MDYTLAPDVEMVVQTVRDYVEKSLLPHEMPIEHGAAIPPAVLREMADLGFFGLPFAEADGGLGLGFLGATLAMEQLGRANAAVGVVLSASSGLAGATIAAAGDAAQRARWLAPLAAGTTLGAFALVEAHSTADGRGLRATATPTGDGSYRLDGAKCWVLNGPDAGCTVVFARLAGDAADAGTGVFVVERGNPGLSLGAPQTALGLHGAGICDLRLDGCLVPEDARLTTGLPAADDPGQALAVRVLLHYGVTLGALACGGAARLIEAAREFALQRKQFGRPVGSFGAVQTMIADSAADLFAAQQAVYRAAWGVEQDRPDEAGRQAAAQLTATEMFAHVADRAMQVHGGMGFMKELWIERGYRDARVFRLLGLPGEELRASIARDLGLPEQA